MHTIASLPSISTSRLAALGARFSELKIVVVGDYCLDRYFDIDPARAEISIETGLVVHNVTGVRCQPGGAGTIINNLSALGIGEIRVVGFCGEDGEGWELRNALAKVRGAELSGFITTRGRQTFTYSKPLVRHEGRPPEELSRLDMKNWTPTPPEVRHALHAALTKAVQGADALIVLEQVDLPEVGAIDPAWLAPDGILAAAAKRMPVLADSRRGLSGWPAVIFKMNAAELAKLSVQPEGSSIPVKEAVAAMVKRNGQPVFVTLSENGIVGGALDGTVYHVASLPVRGPIDIVGAGDSVTANLTAGLAAGASMPEAMSQAMIAASVVIHQLGTTGTANVQQIEETLRGVPATKGGV